jgi:hypothetical protein
MEMLTEAWERRAVLPGQFVGLNAPQMEGVRRATWAPLRHAASVIIQLRIDNMIRTQVSLNENEYHEAKAEAAALGISVAEFVRRAVRGALPSNEDGKWMRFAGMVESGDPQSSASVDELVYGQKD